MTENPTPEAQPSPPAFDPEYVASLVRMVLEMERPEPTKVTSDEVSSEILRHVISTAGLDPSRARHMKVKADTQVHNLAKSIARGLEKGEDIFIHALGPEAVNQAMKGIGVSHQYTPKIVLVRSVVEAGTGSREGSRVSQVTLQIIAA